MGKHLNKNIFWFSLILMFTSKIEAQSKDCDCKINNLSELYVIGQFSTLKNNLKCCINSDDKLSLRNTNRMRELLALTAIAEDSISLASRYLNDIVSSNANYSPENKNIIFEKLLYSTKKESLRVTVSSVSKRPEDLETAPAVVEIIEAKDIIARGYSDLVDLLSDVAGFEISKTYSLNFASIYQLGYRQETTEKTLFMIDGIEENDLWSNIAYISRQYPLSSIKAVEILYGPSSTMYGPRAFVGTINIITYSSKEEAGNYFENEKIEKGSSFYLNSNFTGGSYNTYDADFTMGSSGKDKQVNFQITGRYFRSDEHDMSELPFFNYSVSDLDQFEYDHLGQDFESSNALNNYLSLNNLDPNSPFFNVVDNSIMLSEFGGDKAKEYDKIAYLSQVNGNYLRYSNHTENFFLGSKLEIKDLIIGFRTWKRSEGLNHMQDLDMAPSRNGSIWAPKNTTMYLKYNYTFNDNMSFSVLSSVKNQSLGQETNKVNFRPFGNPSSGLNMRDLILFSEEENVENSIPHGWRNQFYYYQTLQGRTEARLFYNSDNLNITFGTDKRITTSQGDYLFYRNYNTDFVSENSYTEDIKNAYAQNEGESGSGSMLTKNDFYKISEFGTFLQGKLILQNKLHLNFGGRYDRQLVRSLEGYEIFQPRLGIVLTSDKLTIKTNYSKGFQNVSLYNKFSTGGNRIPNPSLKPEEIQYLDASVLGSSEDQKFKWNFTSFIYDVKNAIDSRVTDLGFNQNVNENDYVALGAMLNLKYRNKFVRVDLNSTFIDAYEGNLSPLEVISQEFSSEDEVQEKRVGDLAQFRLNFGLTTFLKNDFFQSSFNLRANYVGEKKVGETTTQYLNLGLNQSNIIPEYLVLNSNFIFGFNKLPSIKFAFSLNNILNKLYYHPGIRSASGKFDLNLRNEGESYNEWITRSLSGKLVPYAIQRGRHFNFKILMDL
jgi:outer membrane cobalamin receptor